MQARVGSNLECMFGQHPANTLQRAAPHCNALQRTETHCITLHQTSIYCHTLQHTATLFGGEAHHVV